MPGYKGIKFIRTALGTPGWGLGNNQHACMLLMDAERTEPTPPCIEEEDKICPVIGDHDP